MIENSYLQAQQVGQRDEAYPFMMSERRRGRISSLGANATICETRPNNNTRPLSCSPPHHSKKLIIFFSSLSLLSSSMRPALRVSLMIIKYLDINHPDSSRLIIQYFMIVTHTVQIAP